MNSSFSFSTVIWREIWQRKSRLISGLLTITLGIAVIIGIESVTSVSKEVVKKKLDLLGANILVLPQAASVDDYYSADIDAPTFPEEYVERIATSMLPGVDNLSPKLSRRIKVSGYPVVLTGIMPSNELASKPIWQASGLMAADLKLACATSSNPSDTTRLDPSVKRATVDSLAATDVWVGNMFTERPSISEAGSGRPSLPGQKSRDILRGVKNPEAVP